jgi:hypothetical protein
MTMKSNASTSRQKELAHKFLQALGGDAEDTEIEVTFANQKAHAVVDGENLGEFSYSEFEELTERMGQGEGAAQSPVEGEQQEAEGPGADEGAEGQEAAPEPATGASEGSSEASSDEGDEQELSLEDYTDEVFAELAEREITVDGDDPEVQSAILDHYDAGDEPGEAASGIGTAFGDEGEGDAAPEEGEARASEGDEGDDDANLEDAQPEPTPKPDGSPKQEKAQKAREAKQERDAQEEGDRSVDLAQAYDDLEEQLRGFIGDLSREATGELDTNSARHAKGYRVVRFEGLAKRFEQLGEKQFANADDLIEFAKEKARESMSDQGMFLDAKFIDRLSKNERSITKGVYLAWAHKRDGLEATFNLTDQIDPDTGAPLVSDSGEPYVRKLGEIAVNKLYKLKDFVFDGNFDRLASFAATRTESDCQALKKIIEAQGTAAIDQILDDIYNHKITLEDGTEATGPMDANTFRKYAAEKTEGASEPEFHNIRVHRSLYNGDWHDVRAAATRIELFLGHQVGGDFVSNEKVLERILQFFVPRREGGLESLLGAYMEGGDMTEKQAETFLKQYKGGKQVKAFEDLDDQERGKLEKAGAKAQE